MRQEIEKTTKTSSRGRQGLSPMGKWAVKAGWFIAAVLLSVQAQAATYYFHNDHLGTPQVLTDQNQTVVWKGEYDPFGKVTETVSTVEQNLRFPGQYLDRETGLHYNYFRTYDPSLGRYLQSDPRGILLDFSDPQRQIAAQMGVPIPFFTRGGTNHLYGYAQQNPIGYTDPTGEFTPIAGAIGGAVAGGAGSFIGTLAAGGTLGEAGSAALDGALLGGSAGFLAGLCGGCAVGAFTGAGFGLLANGSTGAGIANGSSEPDDCP